MTTIDRRGIVVGVATPSVAESDPSAELAIKTPVRAATTAAITLSSEQTIDGVSVIDGDRVLVKNQSDTTQNGLYEASTGNWSRTTDLDTVFQAAKGTVVFVNEGTTNAASAWLISAADPIEPDTTNLTYVQFAGGVTATSTNTFTNKTYDTAGTGNVFKINGVTVTDKIPVAQGGTNIASYAVGDLLYASGAAALSKLAGVAAGQPLISGGVTTAPLYSGGWTKFDATNTRLFLLKASTTSLASVGTTSGLVIQGPDSGEARADIIAGNSDALVAFARFNGTSASTTKVVSGNQIMGLVSLGIGTNGSTAWQQGGSIGSYATQDWADTGTPAHSTEFRFYTIPQSSTGLVLAAKMLDSGGMWINKNPSATAPVSSGTTNPVIQAQAADGAATSLVYDSFGTSTGSFGVYRTARGTQASFTVTQSGDALGGFGWIGASAANTFPNPLPFGSAGGAFILAQATENWSGTAQGTRLDIYTTPATTAVVALSARFHPSGAISVGGTSDPGVGVLSTTKGIKFPSFTVATLPTGATGLAVWASDCRAVNTTTSVQEGGGAGTGALVTYNSTAWKIAGSNVTAVA